jgi:PPOX class probable F420-dependent enzyme
MSEPDRLAGMRSMLDAAAPAVLTLLRADGTALASPVWFRATADAIEVVIAAGDRKIEHLRRDPRCVLLVFETTPPFRGVEIRAPAVLDPDGVAEARRAIATRYLGAEQGGRFADRRGDSGVILRVPLAGARAWDLRAILLTAVDPPPA